MKQFADDFQAECAGLRPVMLRVFEEAYLAAFSSVVSERLPQLKEGIRAAAASANSEQDLHEHVHAVVDECIVDALLAVNDWEVEREAEERLIDTPLREHAARFIQESKEDYRRLLPSRREDEEMDVDDEAENDDDVDDEVDAARPAAAATKGLSSAMTQQEKARAYAISQGWIKDKKVAGKASAAKKAKVVVTPKKPSLAAVLKERQKAREWASRNLENVPAPWSSPKGDENGLTPLSSTSKKTTPSKR